MAACACEAQMSMQLHFGSWACRCRCSCAEAVERSAGPQVTFGLTCALLVFVAATYMFTRTRPVYLLNFHCFKPPAK